MPSPPVLPSLPCGSRSRLRAALLSLTALSSPALVLAQETPPSTLVLDEIVITAAGFEQNVEDAPASITVITAEELEKGNIRSLSDALREVQGVVTTGIANEEDISIRGLPGQYTLILIDGKRQGTRESRTNGSSGFEQSFIPPVSAIDRIEVVRGPMSSLYGSDAMGGVINIITKPVSDTWSGSITGEVTVPQDSKFSSSRQTSVYLNGPLVQDVLGLQIWGRILDRSEAQVDDGLRERDLKNYGARLSYAINPDHKIMLEGNRTTIDDTGRVGNSIPPLATNGQPNSDSFQYNKRDFFSLSYNGNWGATTADISLSRENGERQTAVGDGTGSAISSDRRPKITNDVWEMKYNTPLNFWGEHRLTYGGQYFNAKLKDVNPGLNDGIIREFSAWQAALFLEDEWQIRDEFALTLGARYNKHEEFGSHITPRVYAVWNATDTLTVKGGISTGYRAPDLRSVVPGYYYTTQRGAGVIVSNPDLEPEESTSYELSALYSQSNYTLGATVFRTDFENKIENMNTGTQIVVDGTTYNRWEYFNVGEARIQGLELTGTWDVRPDLQLRASYTLTDSEQRTGDYSGLPLSRTPKHMASLRAEWMAPITDLDVWGAVNYHGKEINSGARIGTNGRPYRYNAAGDVIAYEYDDYLTVDLGANYRLNDHTTLKTAIYNMLDKELYPTDTNTVVEGRSFWLGITASF